MDVMGNATGWVCRPGRYFGNEPSLCRSVPADRMTAEDLEAKNLRLLNAWFANLPTEVWDGKKPLLLFTTDVMFFSRAQLDRFCDLNRFSVEELRLLPCEPIYGLELNADEYYAPDLHPGTELPQTILDAVDLLNETVHEAGPLGWMPEEKSALIL